ncbi:37445_t:CDS:2, partial [Gigaspora margarita]
MSVATTNPNSSIDLCLDNPNVEQKGKYVIALEQLKLQTSECLVIEDSRQ